MDLRLRGRAFAAVLLASLLVLAACGGGDDGDDDTAAPTGGEEDEGTPKPGGTLTMATASDIENLSPITSASFNTDNRIGLIYNRLLAFDVGPDIDYTEQVLVGDLAEEWEIADDGLTYTFHLREGVVWHDVPPVNGRPFVADDVVATFNLIREKGFQKYMLENVASIEAPDDLTVVIRMSAPFAPLINFMANHHMFILPREAVEGKVDLNHAPVGTGPFIMTKHETNVATEYVKNPTFWDEGKPYLDGVRILVIADQQARIAAFRAGEVDVNTSSMSPQEEQALRSTNPDAVWLDVDAAGLGQMGLNPEREPFDDVRVRKAVSRAIDREGMGEAIYDGGTYAAGVAPSLADYVLPLEEREELQRYDPDEAKELLAEAGFPNGFSTTMLITNGYGEQYVRQAQWVAEDLKKVGIDVEIEIVEYGTYFGTRWPNVDYDMQLGPQSALLEPDEWLRAQHRTGAGRNWWNLSDPVLDEMLDEQTRILDPDERRELIYEIQRYLMTEVFNPVQTWSPPTRSPQQPWVRSYHAQFAYGYFTMKNVWLDR